ncbi:MAG: hypothetical protein JKY83_08650 [Rhizobiaceae bacterium]|nr:hypothetical protein [Rhizobiaceae bacterium]
MSKTPSELLKSWIFRQLSDDAAEWFRDRLSKLESDPEKQSFDITFGMVPRKLGKDDLQLNADDLLLPKPPDRDGTHLNGALILLLVY